MGVSGHLFRNMVRRVGSYVSHSFNIVSRGFAVATSGRLNGVNRAIPTFGLPGRLYARGNCACGDLNTGRNADCTVFMRNRSVLTNGCTSVLTMTFTGIGFCCSRGCSHDGFVGGVVLSGVLPNSVCVGTHRLCFGDSISHAIVVVHTLRSGSISICSIIRGLFPSGSGSFIVDVGRDSVTLIGRATRDVSPGAVRGVTTAVTSAVSNRFCARIIVNVNAAIGGLGSLTHSFGRTRTSLRINGMFSARGAVISCSGLNVTHLVCRLPAALYRAFLGRMFGHNSVRDLSRRALFAVRHFFRGGLGISRASEGLFIRHGALICHLRGVGGVANLSLHRFSRTVMFGVTLVMGGCLGDGPVGCWSGKVCG